MKFLLSNCNHKRQKFISVNIYRYMYIYIYFLCLIKQNMIVAINFQLLCNRPKTRISMSLYCQAGKTTVIRRVAVRETGVSRHNGGPIKGNPSIILWWPEGLKGVPSIGPPWCRETPVSWTVARLPGGVAKPTRTYWWWGEFWPGRRVLTSREILVNCHLSQWLLTGIG